jgi:predicted dehydrogenase
MYEQESVAFVDPSQLRASRFRRCRTRRHARHPQGPAGPLSEVVGANSRVRVACVGFSNRFEDALLPSFLKNKDDQNFEHGRARRPLERPPRRGQAKLEEKLGHPIALYKSDEELYEKAKDVDAVIISTADFQHAMHTVHAVKAGKDFLFGEACAEDMDAANAVLDRRERGRKANNRGGAVVQIGSQRRSGNAYHIANDYIRSGKFGDITYVDLCWNVNQPKPRRRGDLPKKLRKPTPTGRCGLLDRSQVAFDPRKYLEFRLFWP